MAALSSCLRGLYDFDIHYTLVLQEYLITLPQDVNVKRPGPNRVFLVALKKKGKV